MAYISDTARVYGDARVSGNARVCGNGVIETSSDYVCIGPAPSSCRWTTIHRDSVIGWRVNVGCFSGTVDEFEARVEETHRDSPAALAWYRAVVVMARAVSAKAEGRS